jgi:hypothetical protein
MIATTFIKISKRMMHREPVPSVDVKSVGEKKKRETKKGDAWRGRK